MTDLTLLASHLGMPDRITSRSAGPCTTTRVPDAEHCLATTTEWAPERPHTTSRSIEMYALNEALAREHLRELSSRRRRARAASELAAANRWHRVELRAVAAQRRHALRAERAASSAVAELAAR